MNRTRDDQVISRAIELSTQENVDTGNIDVVDGMIQVKGHMQLTKIKIIIISIILSIFIVSLSMNIFQLVWILNGHNSGEPQPSYNPLIACPTIVVIQSAASTRDPSFSSTMTMLPSESRTQTIFPSFSSSQTMLPSASKTQSKTPTPDRTPYYGAGIIPASYYQSTSASFTVSHSSYYSSYTLVTISGCYGAAIGSFSYSTPSSLSIYIGNVYDCGILLDSTSSKVNFVCSSVSTSKSLYFYYNNLLTVSDVELYCIT